MTAATPDVAPLIARLEGLASPTDAAGMAGFGIRGARVLGVPVKTLRAIARETGRSHALAEGLWASGIHEARILASIVAEPKRIRTHLWSSSTATSPGPRPPPTMSATS
jgi:3-methyladenine DNA glycosylase AlkD